jgi:hypothetical protein
MSDELTQYDFDALLWHKGCPRKESENADRMEAQRILARLGYLTRSEDGLFSITVKGLKRIATLG